MENFEKFHFHPQKLIFLKISGNSQHQNVSTRNKPQHQMVSTRNKRQHQMVSTRNKPQHQMVSTRNKPQHQNASTRKKSDFVPGRRILVLRFVPGRHHLVLTFVPGRHRLVLRFVPGRHVLVLTITRNFQIFLILRMKMKFFKFFIMFLGSPNVPLSYTKSFFRSDRIPLIVLHSLCIHSCFQIITD